MAKKKEVDLTEEVTVEEPEEAVVEEEEVTVEPKKTKAPKTIKARVVVAYSDKYDKTVHRAGETIEVTQKRFDEINSKRVHVKKA